MPIIKYIMAIGVIFAAGCVAETTSYSRYKHPSQARPASKQAASSSTLKHKTKLSSASSAYQWPLQGKVSFSHKGIDIRADKSIIVYPFAAGRIDFAQRIKGYGYTVIVKHNRGLASVYSNLAQIYVKEGMRVRKSQALGKIGKNAHNGQAFLYFELRRKGHSVNPLLYLQ